MGVRIAWPPRLGPPSPDAVHGEFRRVMADAHVDKSLVRGDIIYSVWRRFPVFIDKIVDFNFFRFSARMVLPSVVLEVSNESFLFCIH